MTFERFHHVSDGILKHQDNGRAKQKKYGEKILFAI